MWASALLLPLATSMLLDLLRDMPEWQRLTLAFDCGRNDSSSRTSSIMARMLSRRLPIAQSCMSSAMEAKVPNVVAILPLDDHHLPRVLPASPAILVFASGIGAGWSGTFSRLDQEIYFLDLQSGTLSEQYHIKQTEVILP